MVVGSLDLHASVSEKKGVFEKGVFSDKIHLLEILENRQTLESKGESNYFLEVQEETLQI